jgi:hypothetical protein
MMAVPADTSWIPEVGRSETSREPAIREIESIPSVLACACAEVSWLIQGLMADGTVNVLTSEPGAGKTTVALVLGNAVARGEAFAGMTTARRPVLVLDRENSAPFICDVLKRLHTTDGNGLWIWGGWLPEQAPDPGSGIVMTWALACNPKPLVIVDSLIAFHSGDENDAGETRAYLTQCRRLADLGATVLLLHHSGKGESSSDYRGSSDIKAAADACFKLANIGPTNCIERLRLKPFKSRFLIESEVLLHYSDGVFTRESGGGSQRATDAELLQELLTKNPGIIGREVERLAAERGVSRSYARTWLANRLRDGAVHGARGVNNARFYTWAGESAQDENAIPF